MWVFGSYEDLYAIQSSWGTRPLLTLSPWEHSSPEVDPVNVNLLKHTLQTKCIHTQKKYILESIICSCSTYIYKYIWDILTYTCT